jgi:hypothetical protein
VEVADGEIARPPRGRARVVAGPARRVDVAPAAALGRGDELGEDLRSPLPVDQRREPQHRVLTKVVDEPVPSRRRQLLRLRRELAEEGERGRRIRGAGGLSLPETRGCGDGERDGSNLPGRHEES